MAESIRFIVPGVRTDEITRGAGGPAAPPIGRLKSAVTLTAERSAGESNVPVDATPDADVVVLRIANGPELWLHPEHAKELLQSQQDDPLSKRGGTEAPPDGAIVVPARLRWKLEDVAPDRGGTRASLGDVLLGAVHVVTGIGEDAAADYAVSKVVQSFDSQVSAGVYALGASALGSLKGKPTDAIKPGSAQQPASLVLIHGTFSQTSGTFGKLWTEHPQAVRALFKKYEDRVYALDHPTLGVSPIANAITLAQAAPDNGVLHLLTHSRGGLVAEVLARVCDPANRAPGNFFVDDAQSAKDLQTLTEIVAAKKLTVGRVVRVACPARGTLLASKRLDAYVSVLKWALELAQVPVAPELIGFLGEVAKRRTDPDKIPGLAAQVPDSPLIQWLHASGSPIAGDLRVVAGDMEGDSVVTWVKTLLSDAFFWTDNDLVVQTRSMYGGSPRQAQSIFVLDQGGKVSHFNYFTNDESAQAIVNALTADKPDGFRTIGPLSWSGESATGERAAVGVGTRTAEEAAKLPALFFLPGILGSNLKVGDDRIWLGWRLLNGFPKLTWDPNSATVQPDGPIGAYYDDIAAFFAEDHDVKPFAFDWRRPIADEATRLAKEIDAALKAREQSGAPVRMIAHSMGGLVARAMQIVQPDTWTRMMKSPGARLLMLGTPNGGSWAPMQVLSGDDTFGNLLTAVGAPFRGNATRQEIADFPGLIDLQAGLNTLSTEAAWQKMADDDVEAVRQHSPWHSLPIQLDQFRWGVPSQAALDDALKLRARLDQQVEKDLKSFASQLFLVVGQAESTPAGYEMTTDRGLVYKNAINGGDGRVTLESALLPGVATWTVAADHGSLPKRREAYGGYHDILTSGVTDKLATLSAQATRGQTGVRPKSDPGLTPDTQAFMFSRPSREWMSVAPPERETQVVASAGRPSPSTIVSAAAALRVTVVNGDLTHTPEPLLIGHYKSSRLTGAEREMDRALGSMMSSSLKRHHYPISVGSHQVFVNRRRKNPWQLPRPEAVIVAGLGPEGELRGKDLVTTVREAVIAWAHRLTERDTIPTEFTLAATLLGSGGTGVSAGQAAQFIAQGVAEANDVLAVDGARPRWPRVSDLKMIELYLDRATEALDALKSLANVSPSRYTITPAVGPGVGALERTANAGYRGADYDFLSAVTVTDPDLGRQVVYTVNTKRARSEVRPQPIQKALLDSLIRTASNAQTADDSIGRTLFSLLVPADLEAFMGSSAETVLELDASTSAVPWEALEPPTPSTVDTRPWSIRTKLVRKLKAPVRITVPDATAENKVLVIGDPKCDRTTYPKLLGARREAQEVLGRLVEGGVRAEGLISGAGGGDEEPNSIQIMNSVMKVPGWRIIHIASHGDLPTTIGSETYPRGIPLSDGAFLSATEIRSLRVTPELVFVNCCHLGATDPKAAFTPVNFGYAEFASRVAQALIEGGVRCVVAAGWAVDDQAACLFANTFYARLLAGDRFIEAVTAARGAAFDAGGKTWAAYQCYGDPDWTFRSEVSDGQTPARRVVGNDFAGVTSAQALILALKAIAVGSEFQNKNQEEQAEQLRFLEAKFPEYCDRGDVLEALGIAWMKGEEFDEAARCLTKAQAAEDGTASLVAVEQLANALARGAWKRLDSIANPTLADLDAARKQITRSTELLKTLDAIGQTMERASLYGSACKRLALIEGKARELETDPAIKARLAEAEQRAIADMWEHYRAGESLGLAAAKTSKGSPMPVFYPAMNRIAAQLALGTGKEGLDISALAPIRESMASVPPDFWSVVGQTELNIYEAVGGARLAQDVDSLIGQFKEYYGIVSAPRQWGSLYDNATFVLSKYRGRATPEEAAAVDKLLAALGELAKREPAGSAQRT